MLESIDRLMQNATTGNYAVGYFESWNFEYIKQRRYGQRDPGDAEAHRAARAAERSSFRFSRYSCRKS